MSDLDWEKIRRSKDAHRDELAALPFAEKMRRLELLRERMREWQGSGRAGSTQRDGVSNIEISVGHWPETPAEPLVANVNPRVGFFGAASALAVMVTSQGSTTTSGVPQRVR